MKFATDFDGSQRQIQASLGLTAKGAENMGEVVKNVYRKGWGESLEQVNQAVVKVYQNMEDVPGDEIQGVTEDVLALAKTFDIDLGETTRGASQLMKQYGMTGKEAMDFIATGMQGGLDVSNEFLDNLAEYTPLFKQAGFTSDQMLTILKNGTRDGAYNLDYVNDLVKEYGIRIQDGSKSTTDAMGKMSKGTQEMWKEFEAGKRPASDVFYSIIKDLKGMDNQVEATQLGVALFGTKFEDLGNQVVYSMGDTNKALGDTNGRMDELRKTQEEAFGQRFQKTLREFQIALAPIGEMLLDLGEKIMPDVKNAVKSIADAFNSLSPEAQKTIAIIGGIATVLGPVMMILGPFISGIGSLIGLFMKAGPLISGVISVISMLAEGIAVVVTVIAGFIGAPVAAVVAAIVGIIAVVTAAIAIFNNWGGVTDWLKEKWEQFKTWFSEMWASVSEACSVIWEQLKTNLSTWWDGVVEYFTTKWEEFKTSWSDFWTVVGTKAQEIWNGIMQWFSELWTSFTTMCDETWTSIKDGFSAFLGIFKGNCTNCRKCLVRNCDPSASFNTNSIHPNMGSDKRTCH
ncbi:phage tail tape measure protein [Bacillus paranthracis]